MKNIFEKDTTVQSGAIRTLTMLKEVLNDVNIIFDKSGARITAMDASLYSINTYENIQTNVKNIIVNNL